MPEDNPQFPPPATPLSFQKMVGKLIDEPDYARFIHGLLLKSREGDAAAADLIDAHFKPLPKELADLKLPQDLAAAGRCTDKTTHHLMLHFAAAAHIWPNDDSADV